MGPWEIARISRQDGFVPYLEDTGAVTAASVNGESERNPTTAACIVNLAQLVQSGWLEELAHCCRVTLDTIISISHRDTQLDG